MAQNFKSYNLPQPDDSHLAFKLMFGQTLSWHEVWIQTISRPDVQVYRALLGDPAVSPVRTYSWLLTGSLLAFLIQALMSKIFNVHFTHELYNRLSILALVLLAPVVGVVVVAATTLLTGIQHFTALLLGGTGHYADLAYLYAAFIVPLLLIYAALALVPCLTWLIIPYALALNVIALEAVYDLGWVKAVISVFWLVPVGAVCACMLVMLATLLAG